MSNRRLRFVAAIAEACLISLDFTPKLYSQSSLLIIWFLNFREAPANKNYFHFLVIISYKIGFRETETRMLFIKLFLIYRVHFTVPLDSFT